MNKGEEKGYQVEVLNVMRAHIAELAGAREKARILHASSDIKSSGNEVEIAVRKILQDILSSKYYVGHGHIIDSRGHVSPQIDIIIASTEMPSVILRAKDGTEYFMYESVYAIAEIKTTYKKHHIPNFRDVIEKTKSLFREETPSNYFEGALLEGLKLSRTERQNPLFSFMVFLEANDFHPEHCAQIYSDANQTTDRVLPNIICLLNQGLICKAFIKDNAIQKYSTIPEDAKDGADGCVTRWILQKFGDSEFLQESNFAMLISQLMIHLQRCKLMEPNITNYYSFLKPEKAIDLQVVRRE
jgi:hypothetical protein